jgi:acetolactate synthase regulatory subunit
MTSVVRLRVEIDDTPGSLARVAGVVADHGGNITAVDVHQSGGASAVDEMTVEFPDAVDLAGLRNDIARRTPARVVSHQTASPVDLVVRVLNRFTTSAGSSGGELLRRLVADLCATPAVWTFPPETAGAYEAGRLALAHPGTAVVVRTSEQLPPLGDTISGEACVLAVAGVRSADRAVVLVARPVSQGFTATEAARVEAAVACAERLASLTFV